MALLLMALQRLVWRCAQTPQGTQTTQGAQTTQGVLDGPSLSFCYPLTFLPSVGAWCLFCYDENYMPTAVVALLLVLLAFWGTQRIKGFRTRIVLSLTLYPCLFYLAGGTALLYAVMWLCAEVIRGAKGQSGRSWWRLGVVPVAAVWVWFWPWLCRQFMQYPYWRLLTGLENYRYHYQPYYPQFIVWGIILLVCLAFWALPVVKRHRTAICVGLALLVVAGSGWSVWRCSDFDKEHALGYDYLVRMQQWDQVVARADHVAPNSTMSLVALNLALAKTNQMGERMFHYRQLGPDGLLLPFHRDFTSPLTTGEAYYHLGLINSAQRHAFESMEAIPNYCKSVRSYKRLAETHLINGQYAAAAKYLRALEQTLFYRKWARETQSYLGDEARINNHPEWGYLRQVRVQERLMFSPTAQNGMLDVLVQEHPQNQLAWDYLLGYALLSKDLNAFAYYFGKYEEATSVRKEEAMSARKEEAIPTHYAQALALYWVQQHPNFEGVLWDIPESVRQQIGDFAKQYQDCVKAQADAAVVLRKPYGTTYWYYAFFGEDKKEAYDERTIQ